MNEQQDLLQTEFVIDDYATTNLLTITKWAKFLGISLAIIVGIFIIGFGIAGTVFFDVFNEKLDWGIEKENIGNFTLIIWIAILILAAISGFFCYLAIMFSILIKRGIVTTNQEAFEKGFVLLKNYFIIVGVFGILGVLFNIISTIFKF